VQGFRGQLSENLIHGNPSFGNIVPGVFTPVLAKHSKSFNLIDTLAVERRSDPECAERFRYSRTCTHT
jgi:hypothetical protein